MTYELSSAYTKTDPSTYLSSGTNSFICTSMPGNVAAEWWKDFGASYFGTNYYFESQFVFTTSTATGSGTNQVFVDMSWSDTQTQAPSFANALFFECFSQASSTFTARLNSYLGSILGVLPVSALGTLNIGTTYYTRLAFLKYFGQNGCFCLQVFSDSAYTTFVTGALFFPASAVPALRYFNPLSSNNSTATKLATATHQNITLATCSAGALDLTTLTYTITGSATSETTYNSDAVKFILKNNVSSNNCWSYYDYTAGAITTDYAFQGGVAISSFVSSSAGILVGSLFSVSNTLNNSNTTNDWQGIDLYFDTTSTCKFCIREVSGGTGYSSGFTSSLGLGQTVFIKFWADHTVGTYGTLNLALYSDPAYTHQLGSTVTLTLHASLTFRYALITSANNFSGTSRAITYYMGGVSISGIPLPHTGSTSVTDGFEIDANSSHSKVAYSSNTDQLGINVLSTHGKIGVTNALMNLGIEGVISNNKTGVTDSIGFLGIDAINAAINAAANIIQQKLGIEITNTAFKIGYTNAVGNLSIDAVLSTTKQGVTALAEQHGLNVINTETAVSGVSVLRIQWRITKPDSASDKEVLVQGLVDSVAPTIMFRRDSDLKSLDMSDGYVKPSNSCVTISAVMIESDPTFYPAVYDAEILTGNLGIGAQESFSAFAQSFGTTDNYFSEGTYVFRDGVCVFGGLTDTEHVDIQASSGNRLVDNTMTADDILRLLLAEAGGPGLVPNGDGSFTFSKPDGSKTRIEGSVINGIRTVTKLDGT